MNKKTLLFICLYLIYAGVVAYFLIYSLLLGKPLMFTIIFSASFIIGWVCTKIGVKLEK